MTYSPPKESISLVIPALNEEEAIVQTLTRAVADMAAISEEPDIDFCEVILVDDGSTDRTRELARQIPGVKLVSYSRNRGYGAAIETGFAVARGSLLSFMDADGTCNPAFLRDLWARMKETGAHVVLGNRLHKQSHIPRTRRIGNTLYAWLLSAISGTHVRDTASGMRLIRREAMNRLRPLPDGLSYTPAMSARCVLDPELSIADIDMPYSERQGESKLHVIRDGLRFLDVILTTAVFYTPLRIFGGLAILSALAAMLGAFIASVASDPLQLYFWGVVAPAALSALLAATGLIFHMFSKRIIPSWPTSRLEHMIARMLRVRYLLAAALVAVGVAGALLIAPLWPTQQIWNYALAGFLVYGANLLIFVACGVFIVKQMDLWKGGAYNPERLLKGVEIVGETAGPDRRP